MKAGIGTRAQAITDIIASVALEQAALSHILNAEGEKIQKIVNIDSAAIAHILKANESVRDMIDTVTQLETVLLSKMELFGNCLCTDSIDSDNCDAQAL